MIHNVLILINSMLYDPVYSILSFILYTMLYNNAPCYIWILDGSYMDSTWIIYEAVSARVVYFLCVYMGCVHGLLVNLIKMR